MPRHKLAPLELVPQTCSAFLRRLCVKMQKTGQQFSLHLIVQALAPESDMDSNNSLADATGTGLTSATRAASVSGHAGTTRGNVNRLTTESEVG
jgi:hypothetical protein